MAALSTAEHDIAISIHAYYVGEVEAGRRACERALLTNLTPEQEATVRQNRVWYTPTLDRLVSTRYVRIEIEPAGQDWNLMNPSIMAHGQGFLLIVRSSNHKIIQGRYIFAGGDDRGRTHNFLVEVTKELELGDPRMLTNPPYRSNGFQTEGFEDARIFAFAGDHYVSATVRDVAPYDDHCRVARLKLNLETATLSNLTVMEPPFPGRHEKNWMPIEGSSRWIYGHLPVQTVEEQSSNAGSTSVQTWGGGEPSMTKNWRGGSQYIDIGSGYLGLIHEVAFLAIGRVYEHRFVLLDQSFKLLGWSPVFVFRETRAIEFTAGLARRGDQLVASFGVRDSEAWLVELSLSEVLSFIRAPGVVG